MRKIVALLMGFNLWLAIWSWLIEISDWIWLILILILISDGIDGRQFCTCYSPALYLWHGDLNLLIAIINVPIEFIVLLYLLNIIIKEISCYLWLIFIWAILLVLNGPPFCFWFILGQLILWLSLWNLILFEFEFFCWWCLYLIYRLVSELVISNNDYYLYFCCKYGD